MQESCGPRTKFLTQPKSDPFHIDATTNAGNISTNLGTPTPVGSSGSQLHVSSQPAPGALLTVNENSGSMNFNNHIYILAKRSSN